MKIQSGQTKDVGFQSWGNRLLIVISFFVCLVAWGLSSPIGSSPDDNFHLPSIWCANGPNNSTCIENNNSFTTPGGVANSPNCYAFQPDKTADCMYLALDGQATTQDYINNNLKLYPELFYIVMNFFVGNDVESSVLKMRVFNAFLFAFMLFWFLSLKSSKDIKQAAIVTISLTLIPLGLFIIPSTNPSSWSVTFGLFFFLGVYNFFDSSSNSLGSRVFTYFSGILFLGARADAGVYAVVILIGVLLKKKRLVHQMKMEKLVFVVIFFLLSILNFLRYFGSKVIKTGLVDSTDTDNFERNPFFLFFYNLIRLPELVIGNFGSRGLGWLDTTPPLVVPFIILSLIVWMVAKLESIKFDLSWLFFALAIYAIPLFILQIGFNRVGEHVQPRYLLPLFLVFLTMLTLNSRGIKISRKEAGVFIFLLSLAHAISLYTNISRYSVGIMRNFITSPSAWNWPGFDSRYTFIIGAISSFIFYKSLFLSIEKSQTSPQKRKK